MNRPFAKLALTAWVFGSAWMTGSTNAAEPKVQAVSARESGYFAVLYVKPSNSANAKLSLQEQLGSVLGGMGTGAKIAMNSELDPVEQFGSVLGGSARVLLVSKAQQSAQK